MRKHSLRDAGLGALGVVLVFVVLFWRLGDATFWDPDEAHYAETSREMIATGDWWAPYYNEQPFFDKPVLFHQLPEDPVVDYGVRRDRLVEQVVWFALRGLGLRDETVRRHYNPRALALFGR